MDVKDIIEMFKDKYGYVKDIEGVLEYLEDNEVSLTLSEEILYTIFEYNLRLQGLLESELKRKNATQHDRCDDVLDNIPQVVPQRDIKTKILDISTYKNAILHCEDTDFITEILPSSFEKDYEDIILSLLLSFYSDINDAFELSRESEEDRDYWLNEIEKIRTVINIIKEYVQENKEDLEKEADENKDISNRKNIIFLTNHNGDARIISDIEGIDISDYPYILTILKNLENGKVKHVKKFYNHDELKHVCAIRQGDVRVFFANISKDSIIILGAIAKRFQNTTAYQELLARRSNRLLSQKEEIISMATDDIFLEKNAETLKKITSLLSIQKKKIKEGE